MERVRVVHLTCDRQCFFQQNAYQWRVKLQYGHILRCNDTAAIAEIAHLTLVRHVLTHHTLNQLFVGRHE